MITNNRYKDVDPIVTITRIKQILKKSRIHVVEKWSSENEIGTFSLRLNIQNTSIGSMGKGVTREYAAASAYAEFMERLQNQVLCRISINSSLVFMNRSKYFMFSDERYFSVEEMMRMDNSFFMSLYAQRGLENATSEQKKTLLKSYKGVNKYYHHNDDDIYSCVPYYSIVKQRVDYLPHPVIYAQYASNGMCAGNSLVEALCEGFFEIYERAIHFKIINQAPELPDIPEDVLAKYPSVYKMYKSVICHDEYSVVVKDCSFGGKYPVLGLLIIDKVHSSYGFKLGAHYDYQIALERIFTEATQCERLSRFSRLNPFSFSDDHLHNPKNSVVKFHIGGSSYPMKSLLFDSKDLYREPSFIKVPCTNEDMLKLIISNFIKDGFDIYIRDVSYMGFPSYQIIIPGFSEMGVLNEMSLKSEESLYYATYLLNDPGRINKSNCTHLIVALFVAFSNNETNTLSGVSGCFSSYDYPGKKYGLDIIYLISMCYVYLNDYKLASKMFNRLMDEIIKCNTESEPIYIVINNYLEGMVLLNNHSEVIHKLTNIFDYEQCRFVDLLFCKTDEIITKQYPAVKIKKKKNMSEPLRIYSIINKELHIMQKKSKY